MVHARLSAGSGLARRVGAQAYRPIGSYSLTLWGDRGAMLLLTLGFLAIAAGLGYVWWYYDTLPGMVPLHFSTDGTVDRFGEKEQLFLLPGFAALLLVLNTALAAYLYLRERVVARMLMAVGTGVGLMFLAGAVNIVRLAFDM